MIEFLTYKGKKYPFRISYYATVMADKENPDNTELESQQDLLWYGLVAGHKMADKELDLDREDMIWVLDACYMDFQRALQEYSKAIIDLQLKAYAENKEEGSTKKK